MQDDKSKNNGWNIVLTKGTESDEKNKRNSCTKLNRESVTGSNIIIIILESLLFVNDRPYV